MSERKGGHVAQTAHGRGEFPQGARVRLTDRAARGLGKTKHKIRIDWASRRGTVRHSSKRGVAVYWDGRTSVEYYSPVVLVMRTAECAPNRDRQRHSEC